MTKPHPRFLIVLIAVTLTASGCSALRADPALVTVGSAPLPATSPSSTTSTVPARDCAPSTADPLPARIEQLEPGAASIAVAEAVFPCADNVVVTAADDLALVAVSAQLAAARGGPLLIMSGDVAGLESELDRLGPRRVTVVGEIPQLVLPVDATREVLSAVPADVATAAYQAMAADIRVDLPTGGIAAAARVLEPIATGAGVWVPASATAQTCDRNEIETVAAITRRARAAQPQGEVWLVDVCSPEIALAAAAAARHRGATVLLVDGRDLWANRALTDALPGNPAAGRVVLLGEMADDVEWQIDALLTDNELPGGGMKLFPDRRIVALYGNPTTSALGVMGEQGPEAAAERARAVAAPYAADGTEILPAFEIIATVASSSATDDGDYSWEMSVDELRPWVETAAREGLYVTLDLQPGRTGFLTQAKRYEELLRLPYVGLALDPEWRLRPNEVHLRQIGSVDAAEINEVVAWLAGLVRDHALPQKLLILHQFRFSMITNRELIESPPELAVLVHVDGQGPIHSKYQTYGALTGAPDADRWWWGWKNFYDEDSPTPTPEQVLELDPLPVYVSYQ